jgi:hypothetical protein
VTAAGGGASGRLLFAALPMPNHEANSSQPERFCCSFGTEDGGTGVVAAGGNVAGLAGGGVGRTGAAVTSAPNSLARVSQLAGFLACSLIGFVSVLRIERAADCVRPK